MEVPQKAEDLNLVTVHPALKLLKLANKTGFVFCIFSYYLLILQKKENTFSGDI